MKVVHLNTYDGNGGAGRACLRLNKALQKQGIESEVWVNFKFGKLAEIKTFNTGLSRAFTAFGILLERFVSSFFSRRLKIPFSVPVWGKSISKHTALQDADIIHLHWVNHGFLRPGDLAGLRKLNKPIVWTFHDSNAFTGGCHVRYGCTRYVHGCGDCPVLKWPGKKDISHKIFKAKERAYAQLNFSVVAPSHWMEKTAGKGSLLTAKALHTIPNTIDTTIFKPYKKAEAKSQLGLDSGKFIMLSGFMPSKKDLHKGTSYLLQALEILVTEMKVDRENIELVVFGNRDQKNVPVFPVKTTFLGTIADDKKLATCYSAADVFLTPSLDDNLPYTVMESLSCGTPVVAFTTGGIPDMVKHEHNGYLAEYRSAADFAAGIHWVYTHAERKLLNENARQTVLDNFNEEKVAAAHIQLYQALINNPE